MYFRKHSINQEKQSQTGESVIHLAGLWVVTSGDIPWEVFLGLMLFLGSDPGKHIINSFTFQDRFINQTYKTRIKPRIWVCLHAQSLSHVRLFATPCTVAHQAPLSMGFSRQEYWSGLPFLLQGIFLTQGLNPGLLHCRQIPYCLNHQESTKKEGLPHSQSFEQSPSDNSQWSRSSHIAKLQNSL